MPEDADALEKEESRNTPTLIKTYGEFWNPELVNWDNTWRLLGKKSPNSRGAVIDVYEERGVYVLYKEYEPVYVGKADSQSIGYRLQLHRQSHSKGPRWDQFSWFGIRGLTPKNKLRAIKTKYHAAEEVLIATLEALLIVTIEPRLNRRKERFRDAVRLYQADADKPLDVEGRLNSIERKVDELLNSRGSE